MLRLPNAAVRFRAPPAMVTGAPAAPALRPDQRLVWLLRDGQPRPAAVPIGVSDGVLSEVLEDGPAPGDTVVTEAVAPSKERARQLWPCLLEPGPRPRVPRGT